MDSKTQTMTVYMCALTDAQFKEKFAIEALDKFLTDAPHEAMLEFADLLEQAIPQFQERFKDNPNFNEETAAELRRIFSSKQHLLAARLVLNVMSSLISAVESELEDGAPEDEED